MSDSTTQRAVRHLSIAYFIPYTTPDGTKTSLVRTARRGETIDASTLADGEEKRLEELGALLPPGSTGKDVEEEHQARLDAYRAERGDTEALQRHAQRVAQTGEVGGIVNVDAPVDASAEDLAAFIRDNKPNADDTIALAENDPEKAARVLEAEHLATEGSPRQVVVDKLSKIVPAE